MDRTSFSKNKLVTNIVFGIISYAVFVSEFYFGLLYHSGITCALVFLCLALYCTVWIGSYVRLQELKKTGMNEESLQKAEQHQSHILSLLGSVTGMLIMCYFLFRGITSGYSVGYNIFLTVMTLYFTYLVRVNIKKL